VLKPVVPQKCRILPSFLPAAGDVTVKVIPGFLHRLNLKKTQAAEVMGVGMDAKT